MRLHRDERGQTLILVALSLPLMLGFVGIATDVGALFKDKRTIQTAADAGAVAGALNLTNSNTVAAAKAATSANGFTDQVSGVTVSVPATPQWTPSNYYHKANYVEVTITKTESTIFLALFGYPSVTVQARAVATNQAPGNGCFDGLNPTGNDLSIQGNVKIKADDCSMNLNSDGSSANAISTTGGAANVTTSYIGAVQSPVATQKGTWNPQPVGGMIPTSDPYGSLAQYSCTSGGGCTCTNCTGNITSPVTPPKTCSNATVSGKTTLQLNPGCYNGISIGNGSVNLASGVYFFNGGISIGGNGSLSGSGGVTLIFTSGAFSMNGTPTMNLTAPDKTGSFPGMLYYQVASDNSPISLGGNSSSTIDGIFYAPKATMTLQGNPGNNVYTDFVVNQLVMAGDATFHSYAALPGGAAGDTSIALVE